MSHVQHSTSWCSSAYAGHASSTVGYRCLLATVDSFLLIRCSDDGHRWSRAYRILHGSTFKQQLLSFAAADAVDGDDNS